MAGGGGGHWVTYIWQKPLHAGKQNHKVTKTHWIGIISVQAPRRELEIFDTDNTVTRKKILENENVFSGTSFSQHTEKSPVDCNNLWKLWEPVFPAETEPKSNFYQCTRGINDSHSILSELLSNRCVTKVTNIVTPSSSQTEVLWRYAGEGRYKPVTPELQLHVEQHFWEQGCWGLL